jgi:primosomal protein N' (replication factor Y)
MQRFGDINMPYIEVADVKDLMRRKMMTLPFSPQLIEEMKKALDNGEQVILFQNRRGYTPVLECRKCGWVPKCQFCDVSLTYHQEFNKMVCHYCGSTYDVPKACPNCGEQEIRSYGLGTEKIEEEVHKLFPQAKTARLDLDTTQSRNAYERILADFSQQKTNILVGTQMVSKGLDFDNVHVVGILDADTMLTRPDFRAFERSFQMMSQVAGRAGRRNKAGHVILQTKHAEYPVVKQILENNYEEMYRNQDADRMNFNYPPYCRLIYIYLRHRNDKTVGEAAKALGISLRQSLGNIVLGPDKPVVSRISLMYIRRIMVKVPLSASTNKVRTSLAAIVKQLSTIPAFHSVNIYYDVDPI